MVPQNTAAQIEPNACCGRRRTVGGRPTPAARKCLSPVPSPGSTPRARRRCGVAGRRGGGGASWAGGARAGGGIPGAGHPEARADLRSGGRGRLDRKAGARTPAVQTGGRLRPARPSRRCWVPDAAAPRGAGPPPCPRLRRRAGNFSAKVILQARPRPRSCWLGVGWTATSGLPGDSWQPGASGWLKRRGVAACTCEGEFPRRAASGWGPPGSTQPAPAGELGRPSPAVPGRVVDCRHGNGWYPDASRLGREVKILRAPGVKKPPFRPRGAGKT